MTTLANHPRAPRPWTPHLAEIVAVRSETPGVSTFDVALEDASTAAAFSFLPGQFNMVYVPGFGEAAISISSDPARRATLSHTVRAAGNVTQALARKRAGDEIALRGPFGSSWPAAQCRGRDVVIACGGIGLAPLRPAIYHILNARADYGRVILLYGARTHHDLLYAQEYDDWRRRGLEVEVTVDIGDDDWPGHIGVVPVLFYRLRLQPARTSILTCGPEIMIRFVVFEALARKVSPDEIFVSLERNMSCGMGLCGRCQLGSYFVCKDGPVFTYRQVASYFHLEDM